MRRAYLGIDTSCYTTSVCLVDGTGSVIGDERIILSVPKGGRGLSQSNMVYQHTRNLPVLMERLRDQLKNCDVQAIGATATPRRRDDSYMPAFLAGLGCARSLAAMMSVQLYTISHQENHLFAVWSSMGRLPEKSFYGLHLSGGTTDLLRAVPDTDGLAITRIGGTSDISAGQFIDRVGVALGFPFPAGRHIDAIAQSVKASVKGDSLYFRNGELSFSGVESKAQRAIQKGAVDAAMMSKWTLATVWRGLEKLLTYGVDAGMDTLTAAGGVMSNRYLRCQLKEYGRTKGITIYLADHGFSADNARGAAFWAAQQEEVHDD